MTEVFFYHLQQKPLEAVLPTLLEKSLERGWRAVVQATSAERLSALVEGASVPSDISAYERVALLFDGGDEEALAAARAQWREMKALGHDTTYWQQDARGRWERKG